MTARTPKNENVLIVGGYGVVGGQIASLLASRNPGLGLIIAGRDAGKAAAATDALPNARPLRVDLDESEPLRDLAGSVDLVVCAANDSHDRLLRASVARGLALIDITRWTARVRDALTVLPAIGPVRAPVVFASSWMASVPATLAAYAARDLERIHSIDIDILYALNDKAGPNSTEYMDRLSAPYEATVDYRPAVRKPFSDARRTVFDGGIEAKTYLFDTPDQMTLPEITRAGTVAARIAFDDSWTTGALAFAVRSGLWRLISGRRFTPLRRKLLYAPGEGGHHRILATIQGLNESGEPVTRRLNIDDPAGQTHLTAVGAVIQTERVLGLQGHNPAEPGIAYAEAVTPGALSVETLTASGVGVTMPGSAAY